MTEQSTSVTKRDEKALARAERVTSAPRVDIYEKAAEFVLVANMPGVSEKTVDVNLDGNELTLSGEVVEYSPDDGGEEHLAYSEFRPLRYRRTFALTEEVDEAKVEASMKNGVLRVSLPKSDAVKPRTIDVSLGERPEETVNSRLFVKREA